MFNGAWDGGPVDDDHADAGLGPIVVNETLDEVLERLKRQPATDHQVTRHTHTHTHTHTSHCRRSIRETIKSIQSASSKEASVIMQFCVLAQGAVLRGAPGRYAPIQSEVAPTACLK